MVSIKRFFGLSKEGQDKKTDVQRAIVESKAKLKNKTKGSKEIDLSSATYIPLPPSPQYWELRQEKNQDFRKAYEKENTRKVLEAYWQKKYNKVVGLIDTIPPYERIGEVGNTFLKAYRQIIQRWKNRGKPLEALKWSSQMIENFSKLVNDTDRRRHNKLIDALGSVGISHNYERCEIESSTRPKEPLFLVSDWCDWSIKTEESLPMSERPDSAFRDVFAMLNGCLFLDKRGKSKNVTEGRAAVQKRNRIGKIAKEAVLSHDIYRIGINPLGVGFAVLSSDCGFYAYGPDMNIIFSKDLRDVGEVKNYVRCVDISPKMGQFLYTIVDQAWCVDKEGNQIWAVKMPAKAGWEKVAERVETFGTSQEVSNALTYMGLTFPYNIENVKKKYRELARKWHPDLHPDDPTMHERMQKLNTAFEILTGAEAMSIMDVESDIIYYKKVFKRKKVDIPDIGSFEFEISMIGPGEDWIYAASFDGLGKYTYIGTYSGRIIQLDNDGNALRVFDVGSVPERIVDKGEYLYILTATRLYILRGETLCRIVDVFEKGKYIIAHSGFGLLAPKTFSWFTEDGELVGEISTKDPIRQVYSTKSELIIETRQHRAKISGAPIWWPGNL